MVFHKVLIVRSLCRAAAARGKLLVTKDLRLDQTL